MHQFKAILGASALALAAAPAAWANVSANDVWTQWKDYVGRSGQTITTTSESMSGDTLTISGLVVTMAEPEMSYTATIDTVTLKENGDGTVSVGLPASYPVVLTLTPPDEAPIKINLSVAQTGMTTTASGDPGAISYAYGADSLTVTLDSFEAPEAGSTTVAASAVLTGLTGNYDFGAGDPQPFDSKLAAQSMMLNVDVDVPEDQGAMKFTLNATNISGNSTGAMPGMTDYKDMAKAIAAGFSVGGALDFGESTYSLDFRDHADTMQAQAAMSGGGVNFAMSGDGMTYGTKATGLDVTVSGSSIPLPQVHLKMAESGFGLTMPVVKSETPQKVGLLVRMVGLEVEDMIWGMVDPTGQLPHDPANIILDLSGTANWLIDILSPDAESGMAEMGMPGQLHTLDINELELTAVGASLTGTGGFTFDNEDLMTWGGMPAPDGTVNLQLVGGNALIDKLVAMGLVPQEQAMGAKMMMGMFAKPGDGPDTLTSEIKVTKDGHLFANGQQLQ